MFYSNVTPLLLFGVNVEWSFNIDLLSGQPWSIGHEFSQDIVRLSNLDRAIGMVQPGTSCHDVSLTFGVNDCQVKRDRDVKDRAKSGRPKEN